MRKREKIRRGRSLICKYIPYYLNKEPHNPILKCIYIQVIKSLAVWPTK